MTDYEEELYKQFSQEANRRRFDSDGILEKASTITRQHKTTTNTFEQATSNKRIQLNVLEYFAKENLCWFENNKQFGIYLDRGGENEVYYNPFSKSVFKLNDFAFAGDDVQNFFDRIKIHNHLFANVAYSLIGFSRNSKGLVCAVLEQAHIQALREAAEDEIVDYMNALGFKTISSDEFSNDMYEVFDAVPNNVLMGDDGNLYFFDTQIKII